MDLGRDSVVVLVFEGVDSLNIWICIFGFDARIEADVLLPWIVAWFEGPDTGDEGCEVPI